MTIQVGIIAEDKSDVDVIESLIKRYKRPRAIKFHSIAPGGCAKVRAKCAAYGANLANRGCTRLIVLHDADERSPKTLRSDLTRAIANSGPKLKVVVIPVKELEAWFLADVAAIGEALNIRKKIKRIPNPESVRRPKERLRDEIYKWSDKKLRYINTIHNQKIAAKCSLVMLRTCDSYVAFDDFVLSNC
jgi:hypothetical protein